MQTKDDEEAYRTMLGGVRAWDRVVLFSAGILSYFFRGRRARFGRNIAARCVKID